MSWHLPHRFTPMHRAISMALLYSVSSVAVMSAAHAVTVGKTVVTSSQHEPLTASIAVTDISAADFSADLANTSVYQQMGLTPTDSMSVRFVPSSDTAGTVVISTAQPVSAPFADVVLTLNNEGKRDIVPKTLLMPLGKSVPAKPANPTAATEQKLNLPTVSATPIQPLIAKVDAPPAMSEAQNTKEDETLVQSDVLTTKITRTISSANAPKTATTSTNEAPIDANLTPRISTSQTSSSAAILTNMAQKNEGEVKTNQQASPTAGTADKQLSILNMEVNRQIKAADKRENVKTQPNTSPTDAADLNDTKASSTPKPPTTPVPEDIAKPSIATNKQPTIEQTTENTASTVSYMVQSNDNLWLISQQIAEQNNIDIQTVMMQIQKQNPDAFIDQDASRLKANAQLNLPRYDVVPSQQSLQTAIAAQRQQYSKSENTAKKQTTQKKKTSTTKTRRTDQPVATKKQARPKARFSVVAPKRDSNTSSTQKKSVTTGGNGLSTNMLTTLSSLRKRNAAQAGRLNTTNNALGRFTQKLQLQNSKLAKLEARLKELRNQ